MIDLIAAYVLAMHSPALAPADTVTTVQEDSPLWSCVDDGNKVCGPGNGNGVPAGPYDEGGVLIDAWPIDAWPLG
jgi:hypothetical protein